MKVVYGWLGNTYNSVKALVEAMLDDLPNYGHRINQQAVEVVITEGGGGSYQEWISIRNVMELMAGREVSLKGGEFILKENV